MAYPYFQLQLPDWISQELTLDTPYPETQQRLELTLWLARGNIAHGGGPFGAAIFSLDSHQLIAPGVNLVLPYNCSVAHAEIVAIMLAQQRLGCYSLSQMPGSGYELVTSTEPCAMCLGAIPWAGLQQVVCGARDADARAIGFDEGDKPANWPQKLQQRGIAVVRDVKRFQARAVLQEYKRQQGVLYNG